MVDLTPIITAVLTLIFSLITAFLIPYIKTKVSAEQFATIKLWVQVAVQAAEMLYVGSGRGEEKKKYVIEFLNSKGFTLNAEEIENLIESAVSMQKLHAKTKEQLL